MPRIPHDYDVGHAYHVLDRSNGGANAKFRCVLDLG